MDNKKTFNKKKFRSAILYLLVHSPCQIIEGKKKLAKLLYFVDFNFFEAFESVFTGASYRALPMGPVPKELDGVIAELGEKEIKIQKKTTGLENDTIVFSLQKNIDPSEFSNVTSDERKVLDKVLLDYGRLSGKVLGDLTHAEAPYNAVTEGEYIPYELAFYRGKSKEELLGK